MNAVKSELLTTVGETSTTRSARPATNIRIDGTLVPDPDAASVLRSFDDLSREFVPQHAGIGIDGMAPSKRMKVAAADTHSPHPNQGFAGHR